MNSLLDDDRMSFRGRIGRPKVMRKGHLHHEIELNYLFSGTITYLAHGVLTAIRPGRLVVFWGAVPHQVIEKSKDARMAWISIPLPWFLGWSLSETFIRQLLQGRFIQAKQDLLDAKTCERWCNDIASGSVQRSEIALLEIEARIRRQALEPLNRRALARPPSQSMAKVEYMARYIATHYRESIYIRDVIAETGLNPAYATTLFRKSCGMTLQYYLKLHRIFHAQRLLATTDSKIIDVALESGFNSVSQFYDAFNHICRESPRKYRMRMRER